MASNATAEGRAKNRRVEVMMPSGEALRQLRSNEKSLSTVLGFELDRLTDRQSLDQWSAELSRILAGKGADSNIVPLQSEAHRKTW